MSEELVKIDKEGLKGIELALGFDEGSSGKKVLECRLDTLRNMVHTIKHQHEKIGELEKEVKSWEDRARENED